MPSQTHQSFCVGRPNGRERFEHFGMFFEFDSLHRTGGVKNGANRPLRDELRVELFERASGGVTGVGKRFFAGGDELCVNGFEFLDGHVGLAAHFEQRRRAFQIQFQRNAPDRFEIGGDVVTRRAVTARNTKRELAVTVMNADGHTVHLRFDDVFDAVAAQVFADGRIERAEFSQRVFVLRTIAFVAVGLLVLGRMIAGLDLVEREHRHEMFDAGKVFAGRAADALGGRFRRDEAGEIFLQLLQFLE